MANDLFDFRKIFVCFSLFKGPKSRVICWELILYHLLNLQLCKANTRNKRLEVSTLGWVAWAMNFGYGVVHDRNDMIAAAACRRRTGHYFF
jgi:hypothetical protein